MSQKQGVGRGWQFKWSRVDVKPGKAGTSFPGQCLGGLRRECGSASPPQVEKSLASVFVRLISDVYRRDAGVTGVLGS